MILLPIIILSIIQGITEFLPISSSGHLVLVHHFFADIDGLINIQEKQMDIAVHIGTLLAVILYFQSDFISLVRGGIDILRLKPQTEEAKQFLWFIIATIPVILCGSALFLIDMTVFDSLQIMAWMSIIFGVILYIADKRPSKNIVEQPTARQALLYGLAQCFALIPGVSRSGITMTAGRFLGHSRTDAARISLLMGMITIAAAGILTSLSFINDGEFDESFITQAVIGIALSFITAYIAILCMMKWFAHKDGNMTPFVIYRVVLGGLLLALLYSGVIA